MPVCAFYHDTQGDTVAVGQHRSLHSEFGAIRWIRPGFPPPPNGALFISPSIANHSQSIPLISSYSKSPKRHISENTPALTHFWNARWALELWQIPVAFKAFHWQPVRRTKKMASIALRGGTEGL